MNGQALYFEFKNCVFIRSGLIMVDWDSLEQYERDSWNDIAELKLFDET